VLPYGADPSFSCATSSVTDKQEADIAKGVMSYHTKGLEVVPAFATDDFRSRHNDEFYTDELGGSPYRNQPLWRVQVVSPTVKILFCGGVLNQLRFVKSSTAVSARAAGS